MIGRYVARGTGYFIGAFMAVLALFPFVWMIVSSFKDRREIWRIPFQFFPESWDLENYRAVFENPQFPMANAMVVTFIVACTAVVLSLLLNTMASYSFARIDFPFKKVFWVICISTMFIPGLAILITSFLVVHALGMLNTIWVLILPGLISGWNIFFFRQFFLNFPRSLEEAAMIDGCSRFRIYRQIFLPMSVPPLVVLGAGIFLGYWNSFIWPSLTVPGNPRLMQIMQVLRSYSSFYGNNYGQILAGACLVAIPPIIMFFIFQRWIIQGVVLSGLKE